MTHFNPRKGLEAKAFELLVGGDEGAVPTFLEFARGTTDVEPAEFAETSVEDATETSETGLWRDISEIFGGMGETHIIQKPDDDCLKADIENPGCATMVLGVEQGRKALFALRLLERFVRENIRWTLGVWRRGPRTTEGSRRGGVMRTTPPRIEGDSTMIKHPTELGFNEAGALGVLHVGNRLREILNIFGIEAAEASGGNSFLRVFSKEK
ncbi:hypothetical protein B0H16DRAFT_750622 [Mycena metata]|uniref:Uncharacterized protein n=1 Tax=Mycena metata TaxID=1033252 RepID=A0AAD7GMH8_9AGAR|nr:hypothetical protein B0H16DRAFT_750622 [Mycena metata]